jgi:hypothetical protein
MVMANKVGRKTKLTEDEVNLVIRIFKEREQYSGQIKYANIHKFANQLFEEKIIKEKPDYSFWSKKGRLGRNRVDQANQVYFETIPTSEGKKFKFPNFSDLIRKKHKNVDELISSFLPIEQELFKMNKRELSLKNELEVSKEKIKKIKSDKKELEDKYKSLENLTFNLYRYLMKSSGSETTKSANLAMQQYFENEGDYLEFLNKQFQGENEGIEAAVVAFHEKKNKKKLSNKFRR